MLAGGYNDTEFRTCIDVYMRIDAALPYEVETRKLNEERSTDFRTPVD
jgi:hypothetical protein